MMKSLSEMFATNIKEYEKKHGIIDMSNQAIPSPIQMDSLGGVK